MRTIILIIILGVVALIAAVATGLIDIRQTRAADVPELSADSNGVTATGGQAPTFDVETGKVAVGTQDKNVTVQVPTIKVQKPQQDNQTVTTNATD